MAKMQNRYPTFLSFILSVCIYGLIFVLFIHFKILNHDTEKEKFTDDLNAYIDIAAIDIDDTPVPVAANEISETENKINVKEIEKVEKEEIKTALKENKASEPKPVSKPEPKQEQTPQTKDEPKLEIKEPDENGEVSKKEKEKPKDSPKVENSKPKLEVNTAKSLFDDVDVKQEQTIASTKKSDKQTKTNAKNLLGNLSAQESMINFAVAWKRFLQIYGKHIMHKLAKMAQLKSQSIKMVVPIYKLLS